MGFGTGPIKKRNGDFVQPTIIDMDKAYGKKKSYEKTLDTSLSDSDRKEMEDYKNSRLSFILSVAPYLGSRDYPHLLIADGVNLSWDKEKIEALDSYARITIASHLERIIDLGINPLDLS